jgi:broad specificity phosphatase PhoE
MTIYEEGNLASLTMLSPALSAEFASLSVAMEALETWLVSLVRLIQYLLKGGQKYEMPKSEDCPVLEVKQSIYQPCPANLGHVLEPLPEGSRRLYILRHGETDQNAAGVLQGGRNVSKLTTKGISQAETVSRALRDQPIQVVASSDMNRAQHTANIIFDALSQDNGNQSLKRVVHEEFQEMNFGDFEGAPIFRCDCPLMTKLRLAYCKYAMKKDHDLKWPGKDAESIRDVQGRGFRGLQQLFAEHDDRYVCLVAHGGFNKMLISGLMGIDEKHVKQRNTSVSVLDQDISTGKWKLQVLDYAPHVGP